MINVWIADLTYTQQSISSDTVPAAIGIIAQYLEDNILEDINIELFKYPEKLISKLEESVPDVIGFSNYIWNSSLSIEFSKLVRQISGDVTIVFGGPNFPNNDKEQKRFLYNNSHIDYYIIKEADYSFCKLVEAVILRRQRKPNIDNVLYIENNKLLSGHSTKRTTNLSEINSPYLSGILDEFIDSNLMPIIQTTRGCPFKCTFCTEGQQYWNKIYHKDSKIIQEEIEYISRCVNKQPLTKRRSDLYIADSNFGMYRHDITTATIISDNRKKYGYPKYIGVSTGKNRQDRVLEIEQILEGSLRLSGSVQSLDQGVLKQIKRSNIDSKQIINLALKANEMGSNSYSEVILGLPGESIDTHFKTLSVLVDAEFTFINMYQLMMLPGTELNDPESVNRYGLKFKYRVLPRCFGRFKYKNNKIITGEVEKICVSTNTLSFSDYLKCREMHFIVNIFYNDGLFDELLKLLRVKMISCWELLLLIFKYKGNDRFNELKKQFIDETVAELWDDEGELKDILSDDLVISNYIKGKAGNNLIQKYKALAVTDYFDDICDVIRNTSISLCGELSDNNLRKLINEIVVFKKYQIKNIFSSNEEYQYTFDFDIFGLSSINSNSIDAIKNKVGKRILFKHSDDQLKMIESYINIYGDNTSGISRILTRVHFKKLFRFPLVL